jgi:hypothetical protein
VQTYPIWKYYPSRERPPIWALQLVDVFADLQSRLDSREGRQLTSDLALAELAPALLDLGYQVEASKRAEDKIRKPVLYGEMGREERAYEVDGFHPEHGIALEVEAGRGTQGNAIYRDLIQTSLLIDAKFLALAVLIDYRFKSSGKQSGSADFVKSASVLDAIYASAKLTLPLEGILLIGY